jgi:hypothetical protein
MLGVIYRFKTSDGGKEVLPCCYAEHVATKRREWHWLAFPEPRPLYGLAWLDSRPVLIVEGEKCVDAARAALGGDEARESVGPSFCECRSTPRARAMAALLVLAAAARSASGDARESGWTAGGFTLPRAD